MYRKLALAVVLAQLLVCATVWAADVQTGNWKLNIAKSQYKTATPPKTQTVTIVPQGKDGIKVTVNAVNPKGETLTVEYAGQYDGKEYPRTETGAGAVPGQMITLKRIDDHTVERVALLKGKKLVTERWQISNDGKTRTVTQSGVGPDGKPVDNVLFYEKQ
jgi:serine protease inhibitor ecotin